MLLANWKVLSFQPTAYSKQMSTSLSQVSNINAGYAGLDNDLCNENCFGHLVTAFHSLKSNFQHFYWLSAGRDTRKYGIIPCDSFRLKPNIMFRHNVIYVEP